MYISAEHHTIYFDLDENEDAVYAMGLLVYLVRNSGEGDIEIESWEIEGYNIFEFIICSLNEYKRVFVRDWLKDDMSQADIKNIKFRVSKSVQNVF